MTAIMADAIPDEAGPTPRSRREAMGRWVMRATWAYAAAVLAVLALIRWVGEAWWGVYVLLFLPRWLFLGPVAALALASGMIRRPAPWTGQWAAQAAIALVVAGPLMGLSVPIARLVRPPVEGDRVRVLTYNVGQAKFDDVGLSVMIELGGIDLICFQEWKNDPAIDSYLSSKGWYRDRTHRIASRFPIVAELGSLPDDSATEQRSTVMLDRVRVRAPSGVEFIAACVHMPTVRWGFNRLRAGDLEGLKLHLAWWRHEMERVASALAEHRGTPLVVGGDFNMPEDDSTMAALGSTYRYAFDEAGWGYGYTRPSRYPWFRIDHLLASPEWEVSRCWVGPDFGSDHLPLVAEFVLTPPPRSGAAR
jgi:endonuclease/exonuclease/phosphatase family metal-dependent hydrolase